MTHHTEITKDLDNKMLHVTRAFSAPVEKVWRAWTEAELLDQWWAPRPWRTETKELNFTTGGKWLYSMNGPQGERSWCRVDLIAVNIQQNFKADTSFCDEVGTIDTNFPTMHWLSEFKSTNTGTLVEVTIAFDEMADLEKIVGLGFKEGFTMALGNLDELLEA